MSQNSAQLKNNLEAIIDMKKINNKQWLSNLRRKLVLKSKQFLSSLADMLNLKQIHSSLPRLPIILLVFAPFFYAYLKTTMKYNVNLLFGRDKWYRFDFLFSYITLREMSNLRWLTSFALLLTLFYLLSIVAKAIVSFSKENARTRIVNDLNNNYDIEPDKWMTKYADTISEFVSRFSATVFGLVLEIWSAIRVNLTRHIGAELLMRFMVCLGLMVIINMLLRFLTRKIAKITAKSKNVNKFLVHFKTTLQESYFFDMGNLFLMVLLLLVPTGKDYDVSNLVKAILFSYNVAAIVAKSIDFIKIMPEAATNYKLWKNTQTIAYK